MNITYINYDHGKVYVEVLSTFQGGNGLMANVKAVEGYPFHSTDIQAQGPTCGLWSSCAGYRIRADFVIVEPSGVELASALDLPETDELAETLEMFGGQQLTSNLPKGEFTPGMQMLIASGALDANGNLKPYKASRRNQPMTLEEMGDDGIQYPY